MEVRKKNNINNAIIAKGRRRTFIINPYITKEEIEASIKNMKGILNKKSLNNK